MLSSYDTITPYSFFPSFSRISSARAGTAATQSAKKREARWNQIPMIRVCRGDAKAATDSACTDTYAVNALTAQRKLPTICFGIAFRQCATSDLLAAGAPLT